MRKVFIGCLALAAFCTGAAQTPWQKIAHPVAGAPSAIGSFANGCIIGAQPLALEAGNYQVLRPDQRRYFGHPDLLLFIQRLLGEVLVGDMAMPAGGRFSSGHASHQSGRISGCRRHASAGALVSCLNLSRWIWWRPTVAGWCRVCGAPKPRR